MQPLYRRATIRAYEQAWLERAARAGEPALLMRTAATALAKAVQTELFSLPPSTRIIALVGPGANGQDAQLALERLEQLGFSGEAWPLTRALDPADLQHWHHSLASGPCVVMDGFLGLGAVAQRPFAPGITTLIEAINRLALKRIAVDFPSGIDPETGALGIDGIAIRADRTVSMLLPHAALRTGHAPAFTGTLLDEPLLEAHRIVPRPELPQPDAWWVEAGRQAPISPIAHKGTQGSVLIVAGCQSMPGAAVLAAQGAIAMNAGKIWVATEVYGSATNALPQTLGSSWSELLDASTDWPGDVMVLGPGMGTGAAALALVQQGLSRTGPLVLDADALNLVAQTPGLQATIAARPHVTVLTPHPLEALRLLGWQDGLQMKDRFALLDQLVARFHCAVVLKGAGTLIGAPGEKPRIVKAISPLLASAGSGDVLAGMLGAVLGRATRARGNTLDAVTDAVCWHAQAAQSQERQGAAVLPIHKLGEAVAQARGRCA